MRQWSLRAKRYAVILCIFRADFRLFAIVGVIETATIDFPANSAPGRHHENGIRDRNYEVRATKSYGDEIGKLIEALIRCYRKIQQRDYGATRRE